MPACERFLAPGTILKRCFVSLEGCGPPRLRYAGSAPFAESAFHRFDRFRAPRKYGMAGAMPSSKEASGSDSVGLVLLSGVARRAKTVARRRAGAIAAACTFAVQSWSLPRLALRRSGRDEKQSQRERGRLPCQQNDHKKAQGADPLRF
jgi:hypothetical protein